MRAASEIPKNTETTSEFDDCAPAPCSIARSGWKVLGPTINPNTAYTRKGKSSSSVANRLFNYSATYDTGFVTG